MCLIKVLFGFKQYFSPSFFQVRELNFKYEWVYSIPTVNIASPCPTSRNQTWSKPSPASVGTTKKLKITETKRTAKTDHSSLESFLGWGSGIINTLIAQKLQKQKARQYFAFSSPLFLRLSQIKNATIAA